MIVFDLECRSGGHRFEGWFSSTGEFTRQQEAGLLACPQCGASDVGKALMAPNLARKGNQKPAPVQRSSPPPAVPAAMPPEAVRMMQAIATMQAETIARSRWVGDDFASQSRAMHYGERDAEIIHGQATLKEARDLHEEGIAVTPLLIPIAPPDEVN